MCDFNIKILKLQIIKIWNYIYFHVCIFCNISRYKFVSAPPKIKELLLARQAWVSNIPIILPSPECKTQTPQQSVREKTKSKKTKLSGETLPDVLQLLHGNTHRKRLSAKKIKTNTETEMTKPQTTNSV